MEPISASSEDVRGKKKSRFKILKSRLFGRMKRKESGRVMKQSQSASDITAPERVREEIDSEDDFLQSEEVLGSRAVSHDSIFLADESQASPQRGPGLSREASQSKIKTLQMKLQKQKFHLGLPRRTVPSKRSEDRGASSEDDGLPHSPPEILLHEGLGMGTAYKRPDAPRYHSSWSSLGTGSEEEEQGSSHPSVHPLPPEYPRHPSSPSHAVPASPPGVDFDTPAYFTPCLDNSAARHRMFIKPKNQRACTRNVLRPRSESLSNMILPQQEKEEEKHCEEAVRLRSYSTTVISRAGEGLAAPGITQPPPAWSPKPLEENDTDHQKKVADGPLQLPPQEETEGLKPTNILSVSAPPQQLEPSQAQVQTYEILAPLSATVGPEETLNSVLEPELIKYPDTANKPQNSKDLVKVNLADSRQRTQSAPEKLPTSNHPVPFSDNTPSIQESPPKLKTENFSALKSSKNRDSPGRDIKGLTQVTVDPHASHQALSTANRARSLSSLDEESTTPKASSLKQNSTSITEGTAQENSHLEPAQRAAVASAGQEDQLSAKTVEPPQQRPSSGAIRFSMSSAWDRPKAYSFTGRDEQAGGKVKEILAKKTSVSHMIKEKPKEELITKEQFLNPILVTKTEESLTLKTSSNSSSHDQPGTKDLPQNPPLAQETKTILSKEVESTQEVGGELGNMCGDLMKTPEGEGDGGKDVKENESGRMPEEREGRTTFGVTLRSTSLSLTYRSDLARSELRPRSSYAEFCAPKPPLNPQSSLPLLPPTSLRGLEKRDPASRNSAVFMDDKIRANAIENLPLGTSVPRKAPCEMSDTPSLSSPPKSDSSDRERAGSFKQGDNWIPPRSASAPRKEDEAHVSEPAWTSMAREKTRGLQQLLSLTSRRSWEYTGQQPTPPPAPKTTPPPAPKTIPPPAPTTTPPPALTTMPPPAPTTTAPPAPKTMPPPAPTTMPPPAPKTTPPPLPKSIPPSVPTTTPPPALTTTPSPAPTTMPPPAPKTTPLPAPKTIPPPAPKATPPPAPNKATPPPTPTTTPPPAPKSPPQPLPLARSERATSVERTERAAEEESKAEPRPALETQSKSDSVAPQIAMADNKCEVKSISKIPEPTSSASPVRRKYRDDRQQTKAGPFSSSTSSTGQPSWLELAKRKSLAWSDKSMD